MQKSTKSLYILQYFRFLVACIVQDFWNLDPQNNYTTLNSVIEYDCIGEYVRT